jgi:TonB-linked SusC/RagA family outer membrane protein
MRITVLLWACIIFQASAEVVYSQSKRISLDLRNVTVEDALNTIEEQSEFYFLYNSKLIDVDRRVNVKAKNQLIFNILDGMFASTDVKYRVEERQIILSLKSWNAPVVAAGRQNVARITGRVIEINGEPVVGANVIEKGTTNGTVTDVDGKFSLNVADNAILQISFIGYITQEVSVLPGMGGGGNPLLVTLLEDAKALEEVVVIGYGTQRRGNIATSITTVKSDVLENRAVQTVGEAIQGQVPGLSVVASPRPGTAPEMNLRGATSLNGAGSPLVLVDGIPGDFNFLNTDDIESINVLKDAASSAIYGSRAANGVILVTTKRGTSGKPVFRYNGYIGLHTPTDMPESVSSATYARVYNEAEQNMGRMPVYSEAEIAKFEDGSDPDRYPNTDWFQYGIRNSTTTRHSIAASGGTESVKYLVSGGFDHQTGVFPRTLHNVFNVRSNTDIAVSRRFSLSFDLRYQLRKRDDLVDMEDAYSRIQHGRPVMVAYYADGSYGYNAGFYINPLVNIFESGNETSDNHDALGIFKFDYEILDGLKLTGIAGVNYVFTNASSHRKQLVYKDPFSGQQTVSEENAVGESRNDRAYYNLQALLNYRKTFGAHTVDAVAGYQQENERSGWITASRGGYPTDLVWVLTAGPKDNWTNDGNASHWALASFFGRVNYDFDNRYILSPSFRFDASSRFTRENRWALFPSIAGAWRISAEPFMESLRRAVDDLKIRVSWGETGSATGLGLYPSYSTVGMGGVVLNGTYRQTALVGAIGNPELSWERTRGLDLGLELLTLDRRLNFSGTYYIKTTRDILIGLPVPLEYGFGNQNTNIGQVENRGYELSAGWEDQIGGFSYGLSANFSDNRNKVLDLAGTGPWISGYTDEGLPFNSLYGYESLGLFQSDEEVRNAPFQNALNKAGDVRYKDQNGDNRVDANDRVVIGDPWPHYQFGITLTAAWKGFDFRLFLQGLGKKDVIRNDRTVQPLRDGPVYEHAMDYWRPDNTDAKYPRILESDDASHNYEVSDFWKINAGYMRAKNMQLGWSLPKRWLTAAGFARARVYVSADNLFTVSDYVPGWDPEITSATVYPFAKTYSLGLNVSF